MTDRDPTDRRVVITGLGPVTPVGIGVDAYWDSLAAARSGIGPITGFDASAFVSRLAGEVKDFDMLAYQPPVKAKARELKKKTKIMARDIQMGCAASMIAADDAELITATRCEEVPGRSPAPDRLGVNLGSCLIAADLHELAYAMTQAVGADGHFSLRTWGGEGPMQQLFPLWLLKYLPNLIACHVTILHQAHGPCNTITSAEVAAHMAIGESLRTIQRGSADVMISGGFECKVNGMGMIRQILLNRLTANNDAGPAACRPFDLRRDGCVAAEGGGAIVLEAARHALARGAGVYAEVAGFATTHSAAALGDLDALCGAIAAAITKAMAEAGVRPGDIGMVVPHGEAGIAHDRMEAAGIRAALGAVADDAYVSPGTGAVGNMGAGNGAVNLARAALAIRHDRVPAAVNCQQPDPACGLNLPAESKPLDGKAVLVTGYSWAGQAAALVLKPFTG